MIRAKALGLNYNTTKRSNLNAFSTLFAISTYPTDASNNLSSLHGICSSSVFVLNYLIEYEQPEYLPSGKDCGSYHDEAERQLDFGYSTKLPK